MFTSKTRLYAKGLEMPKKTINLSERDKEMLEELKLHFDAVSTTEVIRRSISQSSTLSKLVDKEGMLNVSAPDGKEYKLK